MILKEIVSENSILSRSIFKLSFVEIVFPVFLAKTVKEFIFKIPFVIGIVVFYGKTMTIRLVRLEHAEVYVVSEIVLSVTIFVAIFIDFPSKNGLPRYCDLRLFDFFFMLFS